MKRLVQIVIVGLLCVVVGVFAWYSSGPRFVSPRLTPLTNKIITLAIKQSGDDGNLMLTLKNISQSSYRRTWNRYSHAGLLGRFVIEVTDSHGASVPLTQHGENVYALPRPRYFLPSGRPTSTVYLPIDSGEVESFNVKLGNIFKLTSPGDYTVRVTLNPSDVSWDQLSAQSESIPVHIVSTDTGPTLSAMGNYHDMASSYIEK